MARNRPTAVKVSQPFVATNAGWHTEYLSRYGRDTGRLLAPRTISVSISRSCSDANVDDGTPASRSYTCVSLRP